MKQLVVLSFLLSSGCSAVFANQGSPLNSDSSCKYYWTANADLALSASAGAVRVALDDQSGTDAEFKNTLLLMGAVGLATSALMGYGECWDRRHARENLPLAPYPERENRNTDIPPPVFGTSLDYDKPVE